MEKSVAILMVDNSIWRLCYFFLEQLVTTFFVFEVASTTGCQPDESAPFLALFGLLTSQVH